MEKNMETDIFYWGIYWGFSTEYGKIVVLNV